MKALRPVLFASAILLAGCQRNTQQPPPPDEQEIERRVQERLAGERRADEDRRAKEREQQLAERERQLAERERDLQTATKPAVVETAAPEAPVAPANAGPAESYQIFYDSLAPYGAWIALENYGYVWQPRVALQNNRWRPYTVGRWAYTDYGWTWISDEPWGWATYHYGRWARLRRLGWVWVPGDDWAPAWVSWRYSDRFIGWAPLPPEARFDGSGGIREWADEQFGIATDDYVFVPASEFGDDRLADVAAPPEQNVAIFSETANVTNLILSNEIIINNGPNFVVVNSHCRKPIAQLKVERQPASRGEARKTEVKGRTVQFAAPQIKKGNAPARPAQVVTGTSDTKAASTVPSASTSAPANLPAATATQAPAVNSAIAQPTAPRMQSARPAAAAVVNVTPDPRAAEMAIQQQRTLQQAQRAQRQQPSQSQTSAAPSAPDSRPTAETRRALQEAQQTQREQLQAVRAAQEQTRQQQEEAHRAVQQSRQKTQRYEPAETPVPQSQPLQNVPVERPKRVTPDASPLLR